MSEPRGLEAVLAEHAFDYDMGECMCGHRASNLTSHLAAEIRAWLTSEAVMEAAARAVEDTQTIFGSNDEDLACAALTAAAEVET